MMIGNVLGWFQGKARLIIEYVLIGVVVALAGHAVAGWNERKELVSKVQRLSTSLVSITSKLDQQIQVSKDQDKTITQLQRLRMQDEAAIAGLQNDLSATERDDHAVRTRLEQLERNNAAAQTLLGMAVPAELSCLLDNTLCPAGHDAHGH